MGMLFLLQTLALAAACVGAFLDLKTWKIPNWLTFSAMGAGLGLNLLLRGLSGFMESIGGLGLGFLFILLFALGAIKAGDVKLYMAVGAIAGWSFCLDVMVFSILIGGIIAFFLMLTRKSGRKSLQNLWNYGVTMFLTRQFHMYEPGDTSSYFSFGCCIAAGTMIAFGKRRLGI